MSEFKLHIEKGGYVSKSTLLAYLNNELNAADKQHVEHLIAEDPFLQDAKNSAFQLMATCNLPITGLGFVHRCRARPSGQPL